MKDNIDNIGDYLTMYGYVFLGLCFIQKYALYEGYKNIQK